LLKKCPHFKHHGDFKTKGNVENCPHFAHKERNCPHFNKDCPYFGKNHSECPLNEKCPYYADIKKGNLDKIDFTKNDCPLQDKCPYYKEFMAHTGKACPMSGKKGNHKCPHLVIHLN
jgi:hypothetical protein